MIWSTAYTKAALAVVGLAAGALAVSGYVHERERAVKAETVAQTQEQVQKGLTNQITDLQKQMVDRDAAYRQQIASLDDRYRQALTPQQIATLVAQTMGLKQPVTLVTPPATTANPNPAPVAQVSTLDAPAVKDYLQTCETCKLQLPKLQADLADRAKQADLAQQQIDSLKQERDSWKVAAKGGTLWTRTKKALKVVGCAAAGGAVGGASGKGAVPAAIGAGAGAVACSLF